LIKKYKVSSCLS